jgi:hypothetical protein
MADAKSFYDLDYIIEISEARVEQYSSAYQLVQGRITNIILIYSAMGIYLVPIIQDLSEITAPFFRLGTAIFGVLLGISVWFTIRLLIPAKIGHLKMSKEYYQNLLGQYEQREITASMTDAQKTDAKMKINDLLKASYIEELASVQDNNRSVLYRKSSFYYRALLWGLLAVIPYILCIGYHITKKEDKVQKVEIVNVKKS